MPPWEKYQTAPSADGPWSKYGAPGTPTTIAPSAPEVMTEGEALASSIPSRFLAGTVAPAKVLLKLVGPDSIKKQIADVDAMRQRGMEKRGTGFDFAGLAGSMLPGGLIAKGVNAALPVSSAIGRIGQGMVTGAATAGAQPLPGAQDELSLEKLKQMAGGALAGGVVPAAGEALKAVGRGASRLVEPLTESGRDKILKRFLDRTIPDAQKSAVQQATAGATQHVPGSVPTVGEAVSQIPEATALAKFQEVVAKNPAASGGFAAHEATQEGARKSAIGTIAKTPQDYAAQEAVRASNAAANYGKAYEQGIPVDRELKDLLSRPSMVDAVKRAKAMALDKGEKFSTKGATSVQNLHYIKVALDDQLKNPERFGVGAMEASTLRDLQKQLIAKMGDDYNAARTTYAKDSNVLNRMDIGQQLENTLTSSLGTAERGLPFANAVQNAPSTIKKATDGRQVTDDLAKILTHGEMQTVEGVTKDLARKDAFHRLAGKTTLSGDDALAGSVEHRLPNLLNWYATAANKAMGVVGKNAEHKINARAGDLLRNPKAFSQFIGPDVPPRYRPILEEMMRQASGAAGTTAGRSY